MIDIPCRPKELMDAKGKDLEFKQERNHKFAIITVTGNSGGWRKEPLIKSGNIIENLVKIKYLYSPFR